LLILGLRDIADFGIAGFLICGIAHQLNQLLFSGIRIIKVVFKNTDYSVDGSFCGFGISSFCCHPEERGISAAAQISETAIHTSLQIADFVSVLHHEFPRSSG
jgi:hypothetical protein